VPRGLCSEGTDSVTTAMCVRDHACASRAVSVISNHGCRHGYQLARWKARGRLPAAPALAGRQTNASCLFKCHRWSASFTGCVRRGLVKANWLGVAPSTGKNRYARARLRSARASLLAAGDDEWWSGQRVRSAGRCSGETIWNMS